MEKVSESVGLLLGLNSLPPTELAQAYLQIAKAYFKRKIISESRPFIKTFESFGSMSTSSSLESLSKMNHLFFEQLSFLLNILMLSF